MKTIVSEKKLHEIVAESIKKRLAEDNSILGIAKDMNRTLKNMGMQIQNPADKYNVNLSEISKKLANTAESLKEINQYLNGIESDVEEECTNGVASDARLKYMWQDDEDDYDIREKRELAEELYEIGRDIARLISRLDETSDWAETLSPEYKQKRHEEFLRNNR